MIRRFTTPTQELVVPGVDLTGKNTLVTFKQGETILDFTDEDLAIEYDGTDSTITLMLSEQETAQLDEGVVAVQVNYGEGNERMATDVAYIKVGQNLAEWFTQQPIDIGGVK